MRTIHGKKMSVWREGTTDIVGGFVLGKDAANAIADVLKGEGYTVSVKPVGSRGLYSLLGERPIKEQSE